MIDTSRFYFLRRFWEIEGDKFENHYEPLTKLEKFSDSRGYNVEYFSKGERFEEIQKLLTLNNDLSEMTYLAFRFAPRVEGLILTVFPVFEQLNDPDFLNELQTVRNFHKTWRSRFINENYFFMDYRLASDAFQTYLDYPKFKEQAAERFNGFLSNSAENVRYFLNQWDVDEDVEMLTASVIVAKYIKQTLQRLYDEEIWSDESK